jgi:hypothetical protein
MRKVLLIAIMLVGSLVSAGALDLREFIPSVGGKGIVAPRVTMAGMLIHR